MKENKQQKFVEIKNFDKLDEKVQFTIMSLTYLYNLEILRRIETFNFKHYEFVCMNKNTIYQCLLFFNKYDDEEVNKRLKKTIEYLSKGKLLSIDEYVDEVYDCLLQNKINNSCHEYYLFVYNKETIDKYNIQLV